MCVCVWACSREHGYVRTNRQSEDIFAQLFRNVIKFECESLTLKARDELRLGLGLLLGILE